MNNQIYQSKFTELKIEKLYEIEMNSTFLIYVRSYDFCGSYNFCLHAEEIKRVVEKLNELDSNLSGYCEIADSDSDSNINLKFVGQELEVYGRLGGSYEDNNMKFSLVADQTILMNLVYVFTS